MVDEAEDAQGAGGAKKEEEKCRGPGDGAESEEEETEEGDGEFEEVPGGGGGEGGRVGGGRVEVGGGAQGEEADAGLRQIDEGEDGVDAEEEAGGGGGERVGGREHEENVDRDEGGDGGLEERVPEEEVETGTEGFPAEGGEGVDARVPGLDRLLEADPILLLGGHEGGAVENLFQTFEMVDDDGHEDLLDEEADEEEEGDEVEGCARAGVADGRLPRPHHVHRRVHDPCPTFQGGHLEEGEEGGGEVVEGEGRSLGGEARVHPASVLHAGGAEVVETPDASLGRRTIHRGRQEGGSPPPSSTRSRPGNARDGPRQHGRQHLPSSTPSSSPSHQGPRGRLRGGRVAGSVRVRARVEGAREEADA